MLAQSEKKQLDELGYLVLPGFVPPPMLAELRDRVEALCTWNFRGYEHYAQTTSPPGRTIWVNAQASRASEIVARSKYQLDAGGVVTTSPSFTGSVAPGLNDVRTVPSLSPRRYVTS
jgi:hypothetical protein